MGLARVLLQRPRTHARRKRGIGGKGGGTTGIGVARISEKILHVISMSGAYFAGKATAAVSW